MLDPGLALGQLWPPFASAVQNWLMPWVEYYGLRGTIVSGYRSFAEQDQLYRLGRSQWQYSQHVKLQGTQGSVTDAWAGQSPHNYGLAVDIEGPDQAAIISIGKQLGFGTVSWDPAHLEYPNWRSLLG
jgi:hypothetical protein